MAAPQSPADILLTGATGFIGFRVLLDSLAAGYSVRAAVRSLSSVPNLLSNASLAALSPGSKLSFVEVPDLLSPTAYTAALSGVKYVLHIASPMPKPGLDPKTGIFEPALAGVNNILTAALEHPQIQRVVITSSVVANTDLSNPGAYTTAATRVPTPSAQDVVGADAFAAYAASKVAAHAAVDEFAATRQPKFSIVTVMPAFVFGRNPLATSPAALLSSSTNGLLLGPLLGQVSEAPRLGNGVHIDDVARVHVSALKVSLPAGKKRADYGLSSAVVWDEAWGIAEQEFGARIEGKLRRGKQPAVEVGWDAGETERVFGQKLKGWPEMVKTVVGQYLELVEAEEAAKGGEKA